MPNESKENGVGGAGAGKVLYGRVVRVSGPLVVADHMSGSGMYMYICICIFA
jgi:hypothetical protein